MKRVASELDALSGPEKEPAREFLILQGVRFAFRVHQVNSWALSFAVNTYHSIALCNKLPNFTVENATSLKY